MKRKLSLLLALVMALAVLAGCRSDAPAVTPPAPNGEEEAASYKIGIMTGTVSQGEEEFRMAENMKAKYGDMIVTATYPDNFSSETETTISNIIALASDPDIKAIVICQAVSGTAAAIDKIRETRPDMLFVLGTAHEDPQVISSKADIIMGLDQIKSALPIVERAHEAGAKTFIHYSFPRHLSSVTNSARVPLFQQYCEERGIKFVSVISPDPTGDSGLAGTQQFILEDVPRQLAEYGPDTAFFGTNCGMMEPLIKQVMAGGAILPQQCCPSPYHAYPAALNISIPADKQGDIDYIIEQIGIKVAEGGNSGRMSTYRMPMNMAFIEIGVEYAIKFIEGQTDGPMDEAVLRETIEEVAGEGVATVNYFELGDIILKNNFRMYSAHTIF